MPWLADLLPVPADASWPTWMSPVHPDATGSYGAEMEAWAAAELGIELRWWQRLACRRQLEHDREGLLVWPQVVESTPRRAGKSTRIRGLVLWRMQADLWRGTVQTVLHTGSDLFVCRELQQKSWRWSQAHGWGVVRGNGKEQIQAEDGSRWLVRAQTAVYGFDVDLGVIDESWAVAPEVLDEGLEPATEGRTSAQLLMTSTAHRRATSLMRRKIVSAQSDDRHRLLLMLWGASPSDDIGDVATWRRVSPHWSESRHELILDRYERAQRGEADPEADDVDPMQGFAAQYCNRWPDPSKPQETGEAVFTVEEWQALNGYTALGKPQVVAVENWFSEGASAACVTRLPDGVLGITVKDFPDVAQAGRYAMSLGARVLAGKSLSKDPALLGCTPVSQLARLALSDLQRYASEGVFRHDGSEEFTRQALALRLVRGVDGPKIRSTERQDALKAVAFAVSEARQSMGTPMIW